MRSTTFRKFVISLVSLSLLSLGITQSATAAMIGTQQAMQSQARDARITRVETMLARADIARQMVLFGADPMEVQSRVSNLTDTELLALEGSLDQHVAGGGGTIAVIGVVFLVLMILEFVGVIDIFKAR